MIRKVRYPLAVFGVLAVLAAPSPAAAQDREQLQMLAELRMIQEQSGQLRALIATIEETLKALNAKIDQQGDATRKGFADQKLQVDAIRDNVGVLREKMDDTNVRISTLSHEVETLRQTFAAIRESQQAAPVVTLPGDPAAGDPAAPPAAATPPSAAPSAQRMFDTAMADYFGTQYDLAILGFEGYIRTYPTAPNVAQAQYYVGESLFQLQRYKEAVTAYGRVIQDHKGSDREPEALYKQGQSFERLKEIDRARQAYEAVIKNFPDSTAAVHAKQRLQALPR
ncbi:MAG: tol-pal system protein YbgF [Vicinamibacterales bacterium]